MKNSIFLRKQDRYERVAFDEILWAEAQSNYVKVVTQKEEILLSVTLQKLQESLPIPTFVRVHRSFVINVKEVDSIDGNTLYIRSKAIPVSKNKKEEVFRHFRIL